jgi:hypothetical protein
VLLARDATEKRGSVESVWSLYPSSLLLRSEHDQQESSPVLAGGCRCTSHRTPIANSLPGVFHTSVLMDGGSVRRQLSKQKRLFQTRMYRQNRFPYTLGSRHLRDDPKALIEIHGRHFWQVHPCLYSHLEADLFSNLRLDRADLLE